MEKVKNTSWLVPGVLTQWVHYGGYGSCVVGGVIATVVVIVAARWVVCTAVIGTVRWCVR